MKTVYLTKGLPASGKSTWAKSMLKEKPNSYKRINKDDLRAMFDDNHWSKGNEKFVLRMRDLFVLEALKDGKHVIIDDTNLHPRHETRIRQIVKEYAKETGQHIRVEVKFFDVSVEECIRRDLKRMRSVGEQVIRKMYRQHLAPNIVKGPEYKVQDATLPKAIICDLDGTLALLNRNPFDASTCDQDELNVPVANIVKTFKEKGHAIILVSGRMDEYKPQTLLFLEKHQIPYDELLMRKAKDMRKDSIIKREIYQQHIQGKWYIEFILDDRNQVVDMWRSEGLVCCQVAPGDF